MRRHSADGVKEVKRRLLNYSGLGADDLELEPSGAVGILGVANFRVEFIAGAKSLLDGALIDEELAIVSTEITGFVFDFGIGVGVGAGCGE